MDTKEKNKSVLSFNDVSLNYFSDSGETMALNGVSFEIYEGEFISLVGPSGCGKTTILSLISGLLNATAGKITLCGNRISGQDGTGKALSKNDKKALKELKKLQKFDKKTQKKHKNDDFIGYMFQKDQLFEWRTVEKNITLGLEIKHQKTKENLDYAYSLLKKYGLYDFRKKHPHELSGGMRQRVALIRTLVLRPKILLLDEAFSALDYQTRLAVCDDIYHILKSENVTSILVTHDISEAISLSDRVIVLSNRPAHVKNIHEIEIDNAPTPFLRRESVKAKEYFDVIWEELSNEEK